MNKLILLTLITTLTATPALAGRQSGADTSQTITTERDEENRTTTVIRDSDSELSTTTRDDDGNSLSCTASRGANGNLVWPLDCEVNHAK